MRKVCITIEWHDEIPDGASDEQIRQGLMEMMADVKPTKVNWYELPHDGDGDEA